MWQKLHDDMFGKGLTVIAVALDTPEAARPFIEGAKCTYPNLIDVDHHVADLYHIVNVPQAVWIDETGRIVRPAENAGQSNAFRSLARSNSGLSPEQIAHRTGMKTAYADAVRDWVVNGDKSEHVFDAAAARAHLRLPDADAAIGHAHFRLARQLQARGREEEARQHFDEASRLHPNSWNIWRQSAKKEPSGFAAGEDFWARVDALGGKPYHLPIHMKGLRGKD